MAGRVARLLFSRSFKVRQCGAVRQLSTGSVRLSTDTEGLSQFPGAKAAYTEQLEILKPDVENGISIYRVMDRQI